MDVVSRVEDVHIPACLDITQVAESQHSDEELQHLLLAETALKFKKIRFPTVTGVEVEIYCDITTSTVRLYVSKIYRRQIFNSLHCLLHSGTRASKKLITDYRLFYFKKGVKI